MAIIVARQTSKPAEIRRKIERSARLRLKRLLVRIFTCGSVSRSFTALKIIVKMLTEKGSYQSGE